VTADRLALYAENLTKQFDALTAVDGLVLEVEAGKIFGFLGPNGAGKTTTIRLALGLVEPTEGSVRVLGFDVATQGDRVRRGCGVLLEHSGLYERLSAVDNLDYMGRLWGIREPDRRTRIVELLEHFGLGGRGDEVVATWSRGMKQKAALARALLHRPSMVFLDEPTAGLDPVAAAGLRSDLVELARREGVTVFITTHNLDEAERTCDRVGVIQAGRLIAEGSPASLRARAGPSTLTIRGAHLEGGLAALRARREVGGLSWTDGELELHLATDVSAAPIVRILVEHGADIEEVNRGAPTLEDAFLALIDQPGDRP
jgi:ABC-2 type transport system ATP-binding protein